MANPMIPIKSFAVLDPTIDLSEQHVNFFHEYGATDITWLSQPTNTYSTASINFPIILPDEQTVLIRNTVWEQIPVTITFTTGIVAGAHLPYNPAYEAPRAGGIDKCIQNEQYSVNGTTVSYAVNQIIPAMERFEEFPDNISMLMYPDPSQNYNDVAGSNIDPFTSYLSNNNYVSRSSYPITINSNVASNGTSTNGSASISFTLYRKLRFSPFACSGHDEIGLYSQPMNIIENFVGGLGLARLWSRSTAHPAGAITTFNVSFAQPTITFQVKRLRPEVPRPMTTIYPYANCTVYTSTYQNVAAGATISCQSQVLQLSTAPLLIYISCVPSQQTIYANVANATNITDAFMQYAGNFSIQYGTKNNLLANATPIDLFQITKKNGYMHRYTYMDWIGATGATGTGGNNVALSGSIFCINPIEDLNGNDYIQGENAKINFQVQSNFTSIASTTMAWDFNIITVNDGALIQTNNVAQAVDITIADRNTLPKSPYSYRQLKMIAGAEGGSKIGDFFKGAWNKIKTIASPVVNFLKSTKLLSTAAPLLGLIPGVSSFAPAIQKGLQTFGVGEEEGEGDGEGFFAIPQGGEGRRRKSAMTKRIRQSRY